MSIRSSSEAITEFSLYGFNLGVEGNKDVDVVEIEALSWVDVKGSAI